MSCSGKKPNDRKQLYEAIHLYMMKSALANKQYKKTTTLRYHSSLVKTTPHIKTRREVPNSAARWRSIRKHLIQSKASNRRKQCKIQQRNENTPPTHNQVNRNSYQSSQTHYYSHFYLKPKQHTQITQFARQKEQRMP
jgi:hypothetical protein